MGWLAAGDDLPCRPDRVLVAGTSGAGKSTLARQIAAALGIAYFEIDSLYHGPGWTVRPEFNADLDAWMQAPSWVTEWQYHSVRELLADRAQLLVWLDLPKGLVMWRVSVRTLRRSIARTELWNGNREPPLRTILRDEEHIIRWAWRTHGQSLPRITAYLQRRPELPIVRLRSRAEVEAWVRGPLARAGRRPDGQSPDVTGRNDVA